MFVNDPNYACMNASFFYQHHLTQADQTIRSVKQKIKWVTIGRLIIFLAPIYLIYLAIAGNTLYYLHALIAILIFIVLLRYHSKLLQNLRYQEALARIAGSEDTRFCQTHTGTEYSNIEHPFAFDLDIVGKNSLFQLLNRTETPLGAAQLADLLLYPKLSAKAIEQQQRAVKELSKKPDFMLEYRVLSALSEQTEQQTTTLTNWLSQPPKILNNTFLTFTLVMIPVLSLTGIIMVFIGSFKLLCLAVFLNWLLVGSQLQHTNRNHAAVGKQKQGLDNMSRLLEQVTKTSFESPVLVNLQQSYILNKEAVRQLSRLVSIFDQRLNTLLGPLFNSLFLFDLWCVWRIERWKMKYGSSVEEWLGQNAQLEAFISLGSYAYKNNDYVYPSLSSNRIYFQAENLTHPLLSTEEAVSNTFTFDERSRIVIVTGSNMSGKSTFLRMIGVATLCGMVGIPVPATRMEFSPFTIQTSIRISDSLKDHTSYFYAELKRLKRIMDTIKTSEVPSLLFIDEMLKGTNSIEKLDGSMAVIRKLLMQPCVAFIATHDLALGSLANEFPDEVVNYCFESRILKDELVFDYALRKGVAKTTNATFLLHKMNIA